MANRALLTLIAWICLTCAGAALPLTFPALTGRVVDEAGLLSASDRTELASQLSDLETKTKNQLVVVTLRSLQGTSIEDYGYQLGRSWRLGQKDKDSGVLLIVAADKREVRIEVGYGLEGSLTDAQTKLIIENSILPAFKAGDFSGGIKRGTAQIIQILDSDAAGAASGVLPNAAAGSNRPKANTPVWLIIVLGLGGVGLLIFCAVTKGGSACQMIMQMLFLLMLSGRGGSSRGKSSSFSGGGGSFGGGGSSGSW